VGRFFPRGRIALPQATGCGIIPSLWARGRAAAGWAALLAALMAVAALLSCGRALAAGLSLAATALITVPRPSSLLLHWAAGLATASPGIAPARGAARRADAAAEAGSAVGGRPAPFTYRARTVTHTLALKVGWGAAGAAWCLLGAVLSAGPLHSAAAAVQPRSQWAARTEMQLRASLQVDHPVLGYDQLAPVLRGRAQRALCHVPPGGNAPLCSSVCCIPGCVELTAVVHAPAPEDPSDAEHAQQGRQLVAQVQQVVQQLQGDPHSSDFTAGLTIHMAQADQQQLLAVQSGGTGQPLPYTVAQAAAALEQQAQVEGQEGQEAPQAGQQLGWRIQPPCLAVAAAPPSSSSRSAADAGAAVVLSTGRPLLQQLGPCVRLVLQRGTQVLLDHKAPLQAGPAASAGAAEASIR
jgi:hypothetical protein